MPTTPSRFRQLIVALAVLVLALAAGPAGTARAQQDPRQQRDDARRKKADTAAQIDALQADSRQVEQALADLQANVAGQQTAVADARRLAEQAAQAAAMALAEEQAVQAQVAGLKASVRTTAVDAYMSGRQPTDAGALGGGASNDPMIAIARQSYVSATTAQWQESVEQLRSAQQDLAERRAATEAAAARATNAKAAAQEHLTELTSARDTQAAFAAKVSARLDQKLAEAASLASIDANLSQQIAQQEAEVARRNRGAGGGGGGSAPVTIGNVPLTTVRGITVNVAIAANIESLLAAADRDGVALSGSGYRNPQQQIDVRRRNCGDSDYAIYQMPPEQCSPPAARPGASKHEVGLAIDFTYNGSTITSRSSPGFQWMATNAGAHGFINLPSEPWHWSNTGQ